MISLKIFDFLFKRKALSKNADLKETNISNHANDIKLTNNEIEVLKKIGTYKIGQNPKGIINAYHENVPELAKAFIEMGLLQNKTDEDFLNSLKIDDLKTLLKNRGIRTSGKKAELIQRIISYVPREDYDKPLGDTYYISQAGKDLLQEYNNRKADEHISFEIKCINLIKNSEVNLAYLEICKYKRGSPNSGLNIDWGQECKEGLKKREENRLIKHLYYKDSETDFILGDEKELFNACCIYYYLSGTSCRKILNTFNHISTNKYAEDNANNLLLRADMLISIINVQRDLKTYKEDDVKKYQNICGYDSMTCDKCGAMDMKVFNVCNAKIGINCPPFHKGCRCTTVPYFDDTPKGTKIARDRENKNIYIPETMNLSEYRKKYLN